MTRADVVAVVGGLSAAGGALAGAVSALVAAAVLTPSEPVRAAQVAMVAAEYAVTLGVAGAILGTITAFGALRRVPLGRLVLWTNAGAAAGLIAGWLGGPWAWHHFGVLGLLGFSVGAMVSRLAVPASPHAPPAEITAGKSAVVARPPARPHSRTRMEPRGPS